MEIDYKKDVPETVAIVAMGLSRKHYLGDCMRCGGRFGVADETWVVNKLGDVLHHDLVFRMDDLRIMRDTNSKVGMNTDDTLVHDRQTEWMKNHDKPIITSTPYPEFPTSVAYPLEDIINNLGTHYFLTTPAYALAFAIHIGVKCMKIYGFDYVYKENIYVSEQGRGNCEYLLCLAHERGIKIEIAKSSTLLGMNLDISEHLYSYEGIVEVLPDDKEKGKVRVVPRPDETKKRQAQVDKQNLQLLDKLLKQYKPHLLDAPQEKVASQDETLKGDPNVNTEEIYPGGDEHIIPERAGPTDSP